MRDWLQQLFPRLTLETSKLDTNAPESICLLDLEVSFHDKGMFDGAKGSINQDWLEKNLNELINFYLKKSSRKKAWVAAAVLNESMTLSSFLIGVEIF